PPRRRCRACDGALRHDVRPDARPARHGCRKRARGALAPACAARAFQPRRADLCRPLRRPRRPRARDLLDRLDVGLGAARIAAEAAEARQRPRFARSRAGAGGRQGPPAAIGYFDSTCCNLLALLANRNSSEFVAMPTPATMTSDRTATISPYSMAVAPPVS